MSPSLLENLLILIGESFWVFAIATQLHKLIRTRDPKGLSPITQTLNAAGNIAWITYFAANSLWFPVATNIILLVLSLGVLYFILADRTLYKRALGAILVIAPLTSAILIYFPDWSGWLGVAYNAIAATPWLIHVLRTTKLSGISIHALWLDQVAMGCTLAYALLIGSVPLTVGCAQGLLYTWIITYRTYRYRPLPNINS
jgi:uncharacterized protein with PQ loop repeat